MVGFSFQMGSPTKDQFRLLERYAPSGMQMGSRDEWMTYPILVSDNLLHKDRFKWSQQVIETMVASYPGKRFMVNHEWGDVKSSYGVVIDSVLLSMTSIPEAMMNALLEGSPAPEVDRSLVTLHGYQAVMVTAALHKESQLNEEIQKMAVSPVSIGGSPNDMEYICPICQDSFESEHCEHMIPDPWYLYWYDMKMDDERVAPYYIKDCRLDSVEISFVNSPNNPRATILRNIDLERLSLTRFTVETDE